MLFTDIEGSTALLGRLGADRYGEALTAHRIPLFGTVTQAREEKIRNRQTQSESPTNESPAQVPVPALTLTAGDRAATLVLDRRDCVLPVSKPRSDFLHAMHPGRFPGLPGC